MAGPKTWRHETISIGGLNHILQTDEKPVTLYSNRLLTGGIFAAHTNFSANYVVPANLTFVLMGLYLICGTAVRTLTIQQGNTADSETGSVEKFVMTTYDGGLVGAVIPVSCRNTSSEITFASLKYINLKMSAGGTNVGTLIGYTRPN